jgi:hypothetical protein
MANLEFADWLKPFYRRPIHPYLVPPDRSIQNAVANGREGAIPRALRSSLSTISSPGRRMRTCSPREGE